MQCNPALTELIMTEAALIKRLKALQRKAGDVMHARIAELITDIEEKGIQRKIFIKQRKR